MNISVSCTMSKLLILGHILELGSAPLEQHMKTAPVIACPTYRWFPWTHICMERSESIHIMYYVYIISYLVVFLRCGCLWYVAALVCWVSFRVVFLGCKKGLYLYKSDYVESGRLQGWSSWLWRRFHTAEVPGSIPGFCILGLYVIILVMAMKPRPARWSHLMETNWSIPAWVWVLPVLDYFYTWLWSTHTPSLDIDFRLHMAYSDRATNELLEGSNVALKALTEDEISHFCWGPFFLEQAILIHN